MSSRLTSFLAQHIQGVRNSEAEVLGRLSQGASIPRITRQGHVSPFAAKDDAVYEVYVRNCARDTEACFCLVHWLKEHTLFIFSRGPLEKDLKTLSSVPGHVLVPCI